MKPILIAITAFLLIEIYPQTSSRSFTSQTVLFPQGFGIELLNSKGTSGILNNVSNISAMNPASIQQLENLSFGLSYQFQTDIEAAWFADIGTSRVYNYLPQSIGSIYHFNFFSIGIGTGQKYNGSFDVGPIPITTVNFPEGTGEYYVPEFENMLQYYSLAAAYNLKDLFSKNSEISFGVKFNLNRYHEYERIEKVYLNRSIWGSNFEIGTLYKHNYSKEENIQFGLLYKSSINLESGSDYDIITRTAIPGTEPGAIIFEEITVLYLPSEVCLDFAIQPSGKFIFVGSIKEIFWNNAIENIRNQIEFSSSAVYSFNPSLTGSFGFYYTDRNYIDDVLDINSKMDALFLTTGLSFNISIFNVDLTVADSHLYSGDFRKQTIGKIALGVCF